MALMCAYSHFQPGACGCSLKRMANMNIQDRAQYERPDLSGPDRSLRVTRRRPVFIYMALAAVLLAALVYAVAWGIDGWAQGLVLAVVVVTTIGLMIAVSPTRRT